MNLAKLSANGQITVPVEIRRLLGLKSGDKILFFQNQGGEVVVANASAQALSKVQDAFAGLAMTFSNAKRQKHYLTRKCFWQSSPMS